MIVPIRGGEFRNGIGSVLSGLMVCMKSPNARGACDGALPWSRRKAFKFKQPFKFKSGLSQNGTAALPLQEAAAFAVTDASA
jgi:hypothetical protein